MKRHGRTEAIKLRYSRIAKDKKNRVYTLDIVKKYEPYFRKAWIDKSGDIWPYGYVPLRKRMRDELVSAPSTPEPGHTPAVSPFPVTPSSFSPPSHPHRCLPPPPKRLRFAPLGVNPFIYDVCPQVYDDMELIDWSPPCSLPMSPCSPGPSTSSSF